MTVTLTNKEPAPLLRALTQRGATPATPAPPAGVHPMAITSTTATPAQRAWLEQYERETTFEPMYQDELDSGEMTWAEVARRNIDWFEDWSSDAHLRIQRNNPADLEDQVAA
ncbi:hypothetical protein [Pseudomonas aeruginosa]|uniref:hypothetical protein n=2 Tax=Pseudomonas aeruginosa TaxID=287 RepID=UPI001E2BABE2|nr:hypothetical protein [Pseudomonas aeruginosa]MDV2843331.1 hypothetical protein [Pseudomonas aeruginosa]